MWLREPLSLGVKGVVQLARVVALSQFEPIEDRFHTGVEVIWLTAPVFYVEFGRFEAGRRDWVVLVVEAGGGQQSGGRSSLGLKEVHGVRRVAMRSELS